MAQLTPSHIFLAIPYLVNGILPKDIRINSIENIDASFHARYSAKGKIYHYNFCLNRFHSPFRTKYSTHIRQKVDMEALCIAARCFLGTHDFTSFAHEANAGSVARNPIRTLRRLDVVDEGGGYVRLEFEAEGFLYKMVRNITGTLLDVGMGRFKTEDIEKIFEAKDRCKAGRTALAQGLFLIEVQYL